MKVKKLLELAAGKRLPMLASQRRPERSGALFGELSRPAKSNKKPFGWRTEAHPRDSRPCLLRIPILPSTMNQKQASIFGASIASRKPSKQALERKNGKSDHHHLPPGAHSSNWQTRSSACVRARSSRKAAWKMIRRQLGLSAKENDYCSFTEPPRPASDRDLHQLLGATMAVDLSPIRRRSG